LNHADTLITLSGIVHWSISRSSLSDSEIRHNLSGAKDRQFRAWSLPAGVDYDEMPKRWKNFKFGSKNLEYKSSYFRQPSKNIEQLRQLARAGRYETQRLAIENAGKSKVVWGVPELMEDEDAEGRESVEEDAGVTIDTNDGPSAVVIENPVGSDLEQGLEAIEMDNFEQNIVMESDDIETALNDIEVPRYQTIGSAAEATINPHPQTTDPAQDAQYGMSSEPPAVDLEPSGISASEVALESSLSILQLAEGMNDDIPDKAPAGELEESTGSSDVPPGLRSEAVLITRQGLQTMESQSEPAEDHAPEKPTDDTKNDMIT
jgi:hypothetical protein